MHGLMSLWFAPLIELEADLGYFYLCPACHDEVIVPELERIQNRILELHPAAQRSLDQELDAPGPAGAEEPESERAPEEPAEPEPPDEPAETDESAGAEEPAGVDESGAESPDSRDAG